MMQQLTKCALSSSFLRGGVPAPACGQSDAVLCGAAGRPLSKPFGAVRCSFSSTGDHSGERGNPPVNSAAAACRRKNPVMETGMKTKFVYKRGGEISAAGSSSAGAENSGKFGTVLSENYDVTEPTKVEAGTLDSVSDSDVLNRLKQGFVKFKEERFLKESELFQQLAVGQQPKVMVIACADSRVCPTMLMGLNPGDVFTVRNVANLVPPCEKDQGMFHGTSAALEFAVTGLQVEHIIVIGHRNCGGIKALMSRSPEEIESDFIGSWISCALPAKKQTLIQMEGRTFTEQCQYCEQEAVNVSLANLLTFPWIKERFESGKLGLHGWYYDFVEGSLTSWDVRQPSVMAGASR